MKGQQRFIIGLVLALILIVFALLNGQDVSVNFFGIQLKWPLIVIIAVSVLIGAVVTWLISTSAVSSAKKQIRELQQRITELTKSNKTDKPLSQFKHQKRNRQRMRRIPKNRPLRIELSYLAVNRGARDKILSQTNKQIKGTIFRLYDWKIVPFCLHIDYLMRF